MDRRSFLVALGAVSAGCSGREGHDEGDESRPTVTPVEVPEDPSRAADRIPIGDSRFDPDTPRPDDIDLFHRLGDEPGSAFLTPSRESFDDVDTESRMYITNRNDVPVSVDVGWRLLKYSGHQWVSIRAPQIGRNGASTISPGERWVRSHAVERVFGLPVLGPGLYARVETVRPRGGNPRSVGALFRVSNTQFRLEPRREPIERSRETVVVELGERARRELVLERIEAGDDAVELVSEAVGAIPIFRDSLPHLRTARTVRVRTSSAEVAFQYLDWATARDRPVTPGEPLAVDGVTFEARTEERNR